MGDAFNFIIDGDIDAKGSGVLVDLRNSLSISINYFYDISKANLSIDKLEKTDVSTVRHYNILPYFTNKECRFTVGLSDPNNVKYDFEDGVSYALKLRITDSNNVSSQHVIQFKYMEIPPVLSNFNVSFDGTNINISGLKLSPEEDGNLPKIRFMFDQLEKEDNNEETLSEYQPTHDYSKTEVSFDLTGHTLESNHGYLVTAEATWATGYSTFKDATQYVYLNGAVPDAPSVWAAMDVQEDAVASDFPLSITLAASSYTSAPEKVAFVIYDASDVEVARASKDWEAAKKYDLALSDLVLAAAAPLTNGTPYKFSVIVSRKIVIPLYDLESDKTPFSFTQDVIPLAAVTINNTWLLASGGVPTDNMANFNASPDFGISGYFTKTAQFGATYSKNLEHADAATKFKLQYRIGAGAYFDVVSGGLAVAASDSPADRAAAALAAKDASATLVDGLLANIVGLAGPMVFYIPSTQGSVNFNENTAQIHVQVSIDVAPTFWKIGSTETTESSDVCEATPNGLIMVKKIGEYAYTAGSASEPFNSIGDRLQLTVDGVQSSVAAADVAISTQIVKDGSGWTVSAASIPIKFYNNSISPEVNSFKQSELTGLGLYALIKQNIGATRYPSFAMQTGDSALNYSGTLAVSPQASSALVLLYTGTDDATVHTDALHVLCTTTDSSAEIVSNVTLNSGASAGSNFTLLEAGIDVAKVGTGSELSPYGIDMSFSNLDLNIPVEILSKYAFSSRVSVGAADTETEFSVTQRKHADGETEQVPTATISRAAAASLLYGVQYSIKDINNSDAVVWGLAVSNSVPNKNFPVKEDYAVSSFSSKTFNANGQSSIDFKLDLSPAVLDRIDGVDVYILANSVKSLVCTLAASRLAGNDIQLLGADGKLPDGVSAWANGTSAIISFVAFRFDRVASDSSYMKVSCPASEVTMPAIYNYQVVPAPGGVALVGGIIGRDTVLSWAPVAGYSYAVNDVAATSGSTIAINQTAGGANTFTIKSVLNGQSSVGTVVTFNSASVNSTTAVVTPTVASDHRYSLVVTIADATVIGAELNQILWGGILDDQPIELVLSNGFYDISAFSGSVVSLYMQVQARVSYFVDDVAAAAQDFMNMEIGPLAYYVPRTSLDGPITMDGGLVQVDATFKWTDDIAQNTDVSVSYKINGASILSGGVFSLNAGSAVEFSIVKIYTVGGIGYPSLQDIVVFDVNSVDVSNMNVTIDDAASTSDVLSAQWADLDSLLTLSKVLTDDGAPLVLSSGTDGPSVYHNYNITNILVNAKMQVIADVLYTVNGGNPVTNNVVQFGPITQFVARPTAAGGAITLSGGIVQAATQLIWSNGVISGVTYTLANIADVSINMAGGNRAATISDLVSGTEYTLSLKRVYNGVSSAADLIVFTAGSVATNNMSISPVIDNSFSTHEKLRITYAKESSSAVTIVSRRLMNGADELKKSGASVALDDVAASYDFDISAILNTLSILIKAHVSYTVNGAAVDAQEVSIQSAVLANYVARPTAAGGAITLSGGFTNAATQLSWSNAVEVGVSYSLVMGSIAATGLTPGSTSLPNLVSGTEYTLSLTRVFGGFESAADVIVFTAGSVSFLETAISVDLTQSNTSQLFATLKTVSDIVSAGGSNNEFEISGLFVDTDKLALSNGSYSLSGRNGTITLSLKIHAKLQFTLNTVSGQQGEFSDDFVWDTESYVVSGMPSITDIKGAAGKIDMLTDHNGSDPVSVVFLVTQDGTLANPAGKEYILQFSNYIHGTKAQQTTGGDISNFGISLTSGWGFTSNPGNRSVLEAPTAALAAGKVNVLAILSTARGTDIQVNEIDFTS